MERSLINKVHLSTKTTEDRRVRRSRLDNVEMGIGRTIRTVPNMTQGALSAIRPLSESDTMSIIETMIDNRLGISIEWTTDPHPRNIYWDLWCSPIFPYKPDKDSFKRDQTISLGTVGTEINDCFNTLGSVGWGRMSGNHYVKLSFFDPSRGIESTVLSFIIGRPIEEPTFAMKRTEGPGRKIIYAFDVVRY